MKSLKPNFISALFGLLICTIFITIGCKKDKKSPVPELDKNLFGSWTDESLGSGINTQLYFGGRGEFTYTIFYHNGKPSVTSYAGNYTIKADSLKVTINEKTQQDDNQPLVKTPSNIKLYNNTTFKLDGNLLTLKYITYPADAPVLTEFEFHRLLPD